MPNHVHVVLRLRNDHLLWRVMKSLKGFTANQINRRLGSSGTVWQREYFDVSIRDERELASWIEYIQNNPAKAGLKSWPWAG